MVLTFLSKLLKAFFTSTYKLQAIFGGSDEIKQ